MLRGSTCVVLACLIVVAAQWLPKPLWAADVRIFAAASTAKPLQALLDILRREQAIDVTPVLAASGALARQIEFGAPADLFLSANPAWVNWLQERKRLRPDGRVDLIGNCLVLIQPKSAAALLPLGPEFKIRHAKSRIVIGDPAYVPVGEYAVTALSNLMLWPTLSDRAARLPSVRHVMLLVERREAEMGIVYRSDAVTSTRVQIAETIDAALYPEIIYPLAIIKRPKLAHHTRTVFSFLLSERAINVFEEHGFRRLEGTCSE